MNNHPIAILATDVPPRRIVSIYPEPFASMMQGREKHQLGNFFGIQKFGINLTTLEPGARSALLHRHSLQEEFIYIVEGHVTLITENEEALLTPGMCTGFTPNGHAHYLINKTQSKVIYFEVGDRAQDDQVTYPEDDLVAIAMPNKQWKFTHKNGEEY